MPRRAVVLFGLYLQGFARVGCLATGLGGSRREYGDGRQRGFWGLRAPSQALRGESSRERLIARERV